MEPAVWSLILVAIGMVAGLITASIGVIVWVVRLTWWLSEEFKTSRHQASQQIIVAKNEVREQIEAVDTRDRKEHEDMRKEIERLAIAVAKRKS